MTNFIKQYRKNQRKMREVKNTINPQQKTLIDNRLSEVKMRLSKRPLMGYRESISSIDLLPDVRESTSICENIIDIVDSQNYLGDSHLNSKNKIISKNQIGSFHDQNKENKNPQK